VPHRRPALGLRALLALLVAVAVGAATGCGDGDGSDVSPQSLSKLLPPASQLGQLRLEGSLSWKDPVDFVVQGTVLPQGTAPSSAASQIEDAGFAAGAGDILVSQGGGPPINVSVAGFDSTDGASQAQDYLHAQDLEQPCLAACSVSPQDLKIKGIPGATAVHQVPVKTKLPPYIEPFEAYAVEFTLGEDVFYAHASGDPGDIPPGVFERGAVSLYKYARQRQG
jgi:hypothetical protein